MLKWKDHAGACDANEVHVVSFKRIQTEIFAGLDKIVIVEGHKNILHKYNLKKLPTRIFI